MKPLPLFDLMRVWAAVTGVIVAIVHFAALALDLAPLPILPLLIAAIGGFELFLWVQDVVLARNGKARR